VKFVLLLIFASASVVGHAQSRVTHLEALAHANFPDIAEFPAELDLIQKVTTGEIVDRGQGNPWRSESDNADAPLQRWGREREIRAKLIRWLVVSREVQELIDPKGIQISGARIGGDLDLNFANIPFPVTLLRCRMEGLLLIGTTTPSLNLAYSWGKQVTVTTANIVHILSFFAFRSDGQINLGHTHVGDLYCDAATVTNGLIANEITVDGDASFSAAYTGNRLPTPFHLNGQLLLQGARIGGFLNFSGGEFINVGNNGLDLVGATVKGLVFFKTFPGPPGEAQYLDVQGTIDLRTASVGGIFLDQLHWPPAWGLEGLKYNSIYLPTTAFPEAVRFGLTPNAELGLTWLGLDRSGSIQPYEQLAKALNNSGDTLGAT